MEIGEKCITLRANYKLTVMRLKMKHLFPMLVAILFLGGTQPAGAQEKLYFTTEQLPDLIKCMPAPPAFDSPEFANDMVRYSWGKRQRADVPRAEIATGDAVWDPIDTLFSRFAVPFGLEVTPETTPEIYKLLVTAIKTSDQMRVAPKAHYHRLRPFELLDDAMLTGEEIYLRGEGSYPSGHTLRGRMCALLMSQIAPERTDTLMYRAYIYGQSRVIAGAHWQSDVDASHVAAGIAFCALQGSDDYLTQLARAQREYRAKTGTVNPTDDNSRFVTLTDAVPDAILEIRYYGTYNFVGARIDGYEQPVALLTKQAADSLRAVSDDLMARGYRLKIYDAYRPQKGVDHFVRWAQDVPDTLMRAYFYPDLDKSVLFDQEYIMAKSGHTRGSTVDLTLFDMRSEKELDMGGTFDWFGPESHPDFCGNPVTGVYTGDNSKSPRGRSITAEQFANRMILRRAMLAHGFKPIDTEWWHFTLRDEPFPDTYFTFPVKLIK